MPSLQSLNLSHCVDFIDTHSAITHTDICLLRNKLPQLKQIHLLGLPGGVFWPFATHLSQTFFAQCDFAEFATNELVYLYLDCSRVPHVNADLFALPNFPNLQHLVLHAGKQWDQHLLEKILSNRTRLAHLEIRNCPSPDFTNWIKGYNPDREAALVVESMIDHELKLAGYLSSSSVCANTVVDYNTLTSDAGTVVRRKRTYRHKQKVSSCSEAEIMLQGFDLSIVLSDAARGMDGLQSLLISGAHKLTDQTLDSLSLMMTYMQDLTILDCSPHVSEEGAETVRRRCRLLRSLEIRGPKIQIRTDTSKFSNRRHRKKAHTYA